MNALLGATLVLALTLAALADWRAGLATAKITPQTPVPLSGYAARTKPFERVDQDIHAKALALDDGQGSRALLITADICTLPANVVDGISERLAKSGKIARDRITIGCSHTHSGPHVSLKPSTNSGFSAEILDRISSYTRSFQDNLVQAGDRALDTLAPAKLSFGKGLVHFPMNRREFTTNGVILGVNARGFADRSVPVLAIKDPEGKLRAALFVCACHGTTMPSDHLGVSGDYAGHAQAMVESKHPGAQAMFLMGCGGDANPFPRTQLDLAERHGQELAQEVLRVLETKLQPVPAKLSCAMGGVALPLELVDREELERRGASGPSWRTGTAKQMLAMLQRDETLPRRYEAPVAVWQLGANLTWVFLPGEVVSDYVLRLEQLLGPLDLVVSAYCNDVFGYLPSARILREGGYETRGLFSGAGWFAPEAEQVMVDKVRELAGQAGRNIPK